MTLTGPIVTTQRQREQGRSVSDARVLGSESETSGQDESMMPEILVPSRVQRPVQGALRQEPPATVPHVAAPWRPASSQRAPRGAGALSRGSGLQGQVFRGTRPTPPARWHGLGGPTVGSLGGSFLSVTSKSRASHTCRSTFRGRSQLSFF